MRKAGILYLLITLISNCNGQSVSQKSAKELVQVSFVNSNLRFTKGQKVHFKLEKSTKANAWKGERFSLQFAVFSKIDIPDLTIDPIELINTNGESIKDIKARFLNYVKTDTYIPDCVKHRINAYDSLWVTDLIDERVSTHILKDIVQPVWLTIDIPKNSSTGQYKGKIIINADRKYELSLEINVIDHVLPAPEEWAFDLDLWQSPAAIARIHHVPLWSGEHFNLMRPYFNTLAKAGQKNITTSIINEPWGHQTFDDCPSLIKWIKKKNGNWEYDYSLFDKYVEFVMSCGINKRINCYTMIPWSESFLYHDEMLGRDTTIILKTKSEGYKEFWKTMLIDFTQHLKDRNWFNITSISVDERPLEDMKVAINILKEIDSNWKISLAGAYHPEIENDIFDYSIASKSLFKAKSLAKRKKAGKPSTFYTCCVEKYPNGFTFSPPAEHVWLGWYAAAKGFTGYLRWAYNSWPLNPSEDSRYTAWPGGDTYQIYPGPKTSIRFEKLIEGVQDFEKIRILKDLYSKQNRMRELKQLNQQLSTFEIKSLEKKSASAMISNAQKIINLSKPD